MADRDGDEGTPTGRGPSLRRRVRRRLAWWTLAAGSLLLLSWVVLTAVLLAGVREDLTGVEDDILAARGALQDLQHDLARTRLEQAVDPLARSRGRIQSLPVQAAAALPVVRPNLIAVEELILSTEEVVGAGLRAVDVASDVQDSIDGLVPGDGHIPLQPWLDLASVLREAAETIGRAQAQVEGVSDPRLLAPVASARDRFLDMLRPVSAQIDRAAAIAELVPALLGADRRRSYFVGAANPAEPRGSGGLIGAWSILVVDDGRFAFGPFTPIQDLPDLIPSPLDPPEASLGSRYDRFGGTGVWRNLNMTPDFPSAARQIEQLYAETHGPALDGTILVDPFALELLLDPVDELSVPGIGQVPAGEIVQFLVTDAYGEIESSERRKRLLGDVATEAFVRFLGGIGRQDPAGAVHRLATAIASEHVLVHAADPHAQGQLEQLGAAGAFASDDGDLLAVIANDGSATKLGAFVHRDLTYRVQLRPDGSAIGHARVQLANEASPTGLPQYVIGPNVDFLEAGEVLLLVSTYCAASCDLVEDPGRGWQGRPSVVEAELGHPVVSTWVDLAAGASRDLSYTWEVAEAWRREDGQGVYRLSYQHQTSITPVRLTVEVEVPPGFVVFGDDHGGRASGRTVRWELDAERDQVFELSLRDG